MLWRKHTESMWAHKKAALARLCTGFVWDTDDAVLSMLSSSYSSVTLYLSLYFQWQALWLGIYWVIKTFNQLTFCNNKILNDFM